MVVISKVLFNKVINKESCTPIFHPNFKTCSGFRTFVFYNCVKGIIKFYASIYTLELLMHHKNIDKEFLKKHLVYFLRSFAYGLVMATTVFSSVCWLRNIIGKFYYYTCILVPGFLSGFSIFIENPRMKIINTILFATLALETCANYLKGEGFVRHSIVTDTSFFMINNAVFMYLFKTNALANKATLLWFYDPRPKKNNQEINPVPFCCTGKYKCFQHVVLKDFTKYFGTGYVFHIARKLLPNIPKLIRKPLSIFSIILNKQAVYNGLFFGTYVLIYKIVCRYLYELDGRENGRQSLIAGFLAGLSYSINPSLQMNLLPLTLTMQLLWINFREKYKIPKWYFQELFFSVCCGIMFHFRFLLQDYAASYIKNVFSVTTNGQTNVLVDNINKFVESKIKQKGICITKNMYIAR